MAATLSVIDGVSNTIRTTTPLPINQPHSDSSQPGHKLHLHHCFPGHWHSVGGQRRDRYSILSGIALIGNSPSALAVNSLTNRIYVTDNATRWACGRD